jgi:hypothetical protein
MRRLWIAVVVAASAGVLAATGVRGQMARAADPRLALPATLDRALRSEIEAARSSSALEQVLDRHPDHADILVPRIEAITTDEIRSEGPGARFAIEEMTPNDSPARSVTLQTSARGPTLVKEFPSDAFDTVDGSPGASFGDGSIHRYSGRIPFAPELTIVGDGDRNHRLTFTIVAPYGMVYVRGTGRIVLAVDGQEKTIQLGT